MFKRFFPWRKILESAEIFTRINQKEIRKKAGIGWLPFIGNPAV